MKMRFDAALDGASFAEIDETVILLDIDEPPAEEDIDLARRAMHPGTRITSRIRRKLSVRLRFVVREYDIARRAWIMDRITAWAAKGGWLTINSRPGQRLRVVPERLPAMGSSLKWTAEIELTLTAYERPYWEQIQPMRVTITGEGTITPDGTVPTSYVECEAVNNGTGSLTTITMRCADTVIRMDGLDVAPGETVAVRYTDADVLTITAAGVSALANRTADSSDDLVAASMTENTIKVEADQPVSATFAARGRWL